LDHLFGLEYGDALKIMWITGTIIILTLLLLILGNVFLSRMRLANARGRILASASEAYKIIDDDIFFDASNEDYRAVIKKPMLFPFGTWAMESSGDIIWISQAQIDQGMRLR
jgi:hypothetical protein